MTDFSLQLLPYQDKEIRFVGTSDRPEWVGVDIVAILYPEVEPNNRSSYLRGVSTEWKGLQKVQTLGGEQEMTTVLEPGLYCLIARSHSPIAVPFQKWMFEEVLPTIRKTGEYRVQQTVYQGPISPTRSKGLKPFKEKSEISEQQLRVYCFVKDCDRWMTNSEIAEGAGIAKTSIRSFVLYFSKAGLFDFMETWPKHLYRFSERAEQRNPNMYARMENAVRILGNPLDRRLPTL
jgi:prophage antirepressor-like protein